MGNCATKPKVFKDSGKDLIPVEPETTALSKHNKDSAEKSENNALNAAEKAVVAAAVSAAARRSEKGKEILIEDDVEEHSKRQSLSHLFLEDKTIEKEITDLSPTKLKTNNKTVASSEVSKPDASAIIAFKVKIPKDSEIKTLETPKAMEVEEQAGVKFPEELETKKTSEVVKAAEESKHPEVSEVFAEIKVTKELDVPEVLEVSEASKVKADEVKVAESELLKVSEVKTDQETTNVKTEKETEASEFVDAQEKIDKPGAQILDEGIEVRERQNRI